MDDTKRERVRFWLLKAHSDLRSARALVALEELDQAAARTLNQRASMDARHFKAPHLRHTDIWEQAEELRQRLPPLATLPVPVLDLTEFDWGLELVLNANLRRADDTTPP